MTEPLTKNDPEYWQLASDYELEICLRRTIPSLREHELALQEMVRRKNDNEGKDRATQQNIKAMTRVILILTFFGLVVGLIALFTK